MLRRLVPAVLLTATAVAVACGGDDDGATAAPTTPPASATAAVQAPPAAKAATGVRLVRVGSFSSPTFATAAPGDRRRLYVVEQGGTIRVVRGGRTLSTPFLDIGDRVLNGGEQGLLGLAFPRDHARTGLFYVYYTRRDGRQTLVEFKRTSADRADAGSARQVFVHDDPEPNHNGGSLAFGPDGLLYVGTGDGGSGDDPHGARGNGQNLGSPLGKLLRIDPRRSGGQPFRVPSSNPFVNRSGARPEVYAYGLRNPWRFSFDRRTGDIAIADVGQNAVEEINFARRGKARGANYGWRPWEGRTRNFEEPAPGHKPPAITHGHGDGWCSITGGYVVRDPALPASLRGRYVYADFCKGEIMSARLRLPTAQAVRRVANLPRVDSVASFGEDAAGRIYVVSLGGPVYRLAAR